MVCFLEKVKKESKTFLNFLKTYPGVVVAGRFVDRFKARKPGKSILQVCFRKVACKCRVENLLQEWLSIDPIPILGKMKACVQRAHQAKVSTTVRYYRYMIDSHFLV